MYSEAMVTIELKEYNDLKTTILNLQKPEGEGLSEPELQEATGILLQKALNNPSLFRNGGLISLGKYNAQIWQVGTEILANPMDNAKTSSKLLVSIKRL